MMAISGPPWPLFPGTVSAHGVKWGWGTRQMDDSCPELSSVGCCPLGVDEGLRSWLSSLILSVSIPLLPSLALVGFDIA